MGWLGYTEQETLDTTMPALMRGYEGRLKMLRACYGGSEDETPEAPAAEPVLAVQAQTAFRALAGKRT